MLSGFKSRVDLFNGKSVMFWAQEYHSPHFCVAKMNWDSPCVLGGGFELEDGFVFIKQCECNWRRPCQTLTLALFSYPPPGSPQVGNSHPGSEYTPKIFHPKIAVSVKPWMCDLISRLTFASWGEEASREGLRWVQCVCVDKHRERASASWAEKELHSCVVPETVAQACKIKRDSCLSNSCLVASPRKWWWWPPAGGSYTPW